MLRHPITLAVLASEGDTADVGTEVAGLVFPHGGVRASFVEAAEEFRAERGDDRAGRDLDEVGADGASPAGFAALVAALRARALEETPRPPGRVPQTTLWWTCGAEFYGFLDIRHRLTTELLERGGHIGYAIRPSARRQGHATAMLRAALPHARQLGIYQVLVTCDAFNEPSRRGIEANGGVLQDHRGAKLRFWITT